MVRWWSCSWFVCTHRTQFRWQRCCMGDKRAVFEVLSFMSRLFLSCLYIIYVSFGDRHRRWSVPLPQRRNNLPGWPHFLVPFCSLLSFVVLVPAVKLLLISPHLCLQIEDEYDRIKAQRVNEAVMFRKISKLKDPSKRCAPWFCFVVVFLPLLLYKESCVKPCVGDCRAVCGVCLVVVISLTAPVGTLPSSALWCCCLRCCSGTIIYPSKHISSLFPLCNAPPYRSLPHPLPSTLYPAALPLSLPCPASL